MPDEVTFHPEDALLSRIRATAGKRDVVVLAGSALTMPVGDIPGVPTARGIVNMIRDELAGEAAARQALEQALKDAANPYQNAFETLNAWRGPEGVNRVIRKAVLKARLPGAPRSADAVLNAMLPAHLDECEALEGDVTGWALSPGVAALGRLAARHGRFGQTILTTNFDPLVEVAITHAQGNWYRLDMGSDGSLGQAGGKGARVVHVHGHWYGKLTLHTPLQLRQERPRLDTSLRRLLDRDRVLLVLAYGGWDDVLTRALAAVLRDDEARPEVLWTFYSDDEASIRREHGQLLSNLTAGTGTSRVSFFRGIDVHKFLPRLADALVPTRGPNDTPTVTRPARPSQAELSVAQVNAKSPEVSLDMAVVAAQQAFVERITGIRFLWIPGGTFTMGDEDLGPECRPPHRVQVSPFWLAETPVTNRQYAKFLEQRRAREPSKRSDQRFNQSEQPVVGVSWREARAFCRWLSEVVPEWHIELPTEAQWEFAARGKEGRRYPWGAEAPDEQRAHFYKQTGAPLPVGSRPAGQGPYGHQDLAGNVWEWCLDAWDDQAYENRGPLTIDPGMADESGDDAAQGRACRGGAFLSGSRTLRSAFRDWAPADDRRPLLGFRVAALPASR
jgi:formylglycine-generating enzyme required for sulfatase activity